MASSVLDALVNVAVNAGARVIAPDSLALAGGDGDNGLRHCSLASRQAAALLRPGDIVFVNTPGKFYNFWRTAACTPYDHVGIVVTGGSCVHVSPPVVRLLPTARLLSAERQPLVLRPNVSATTRTAIVWAAQRLVGDKYAAERALGLMGRLIAANRLGLRHMVTPMAPLGSSTSASMSNRWICTDLVFLVLFQHWPEFRKKALHCKPQLDAIEHGSASAADFIMMWNQYPALFKEVALSPSVLRGTAKAPQQQEVASVFDGLPPHKAEEESWVSRWRGNFGQLLGVRQGGVQRHPRRDGGSSSSSSGGGGWGGGRAADTHSLRSLKDAVTASRVRAQRKLQQAWPSVFKTRRRPQSPPPTPPVPGTLDLAARVRLLTRVARGIQMLAKVVLLPVSVATEALLALLGWSKAPGGGGGIRAAATWLGTWLPGGRAAVGGMAVVLYVALLGVAAGRAMAVAGALRRAAVVLVKRVAVLTAVAAAGAWLVRGRSRAKL